MNHFSFVLLLNLLLPFNLSSQTVSLVYPTFERYQNFTDAYVAPGGQGFVIGTCSEFYKTTDDGLSWAVATKPDERFALTAIQCAAGTNCTVVYLTTSRGLYRSSDAGTTWAKVSDRAMTHFDFSQVGLVYGYQRGVNTMSSSTDDGLTWSEISLPTRLTDDLQIVSSDRFAMIGDSSFYRTLDGGATWEETIQFDNRSVLITTDSDGAHYVETRGSGIYKSQDDGATWTQKTENAHQYTSYNDLYKDAEDSLHVISYYGSRFSSGDDGLTWVNTSRGIRFQPYRSYRRAEGRLIMGGEGLTLLAGKADYTDMKPLVSERTVKIREIAFHDTNTGYGFGEGGEVLRTQDGGASWNLASQIGDWMGSRPKLGNDGSIYGALGFTDFARSTNEGETWNELAAANQALGGGRRVFDVLPNGEVVVMTNQKTVRLDVDNNVISAKDGGHPSTSGGTFDLKMVDANLGFIIRWARLDIYRTEDGGVTWDTIPAFGGNNFFNWFEVEDEETFIIGNGSLSWRTTDAGKNWSVYHPEAALGRFFIGEDLYGFSNIMLKRSSDGGDTWPEMLRTCGQPLDMARRPGTNEVFLAYQNGIERIDIDELISPVFQARQAVKSLKSWPVPTGNNVYVSLPKNHLSGGNTDLFDLTGRKVSAPISRNGEQLQIEMNSLKPGCYLLRYVARSGELYQTRLIKR